MRSVFVIIAVGILAGCGTAVQTPAPPVVSSYTPNQDDHRYRYPVKDRYYNPRKLKAQKEEEPVQAQKKQPQKEPPRPWDVTDDRFITTHPLNASVEALQRSRDEIVGRLKDLNINLDQVPTSPKG